MPKPRVTYNDPLVGRVRIARSTAVRIIRDWRAAGYRVGYLRLPSGQANRSVRRWAFYGINDDYYLGWSR